MKDDWLYTWLSVKRNPRSTGGTKEVEVKKKKNKGWRRKDGKMKVSKNKPHETNGWHKAALVFKGEQDI
jgi:hypothetical protein